MDFEFKRYVVANDHCYTPYTSPSQRNLPDVTETEVTPATTIRPKLSSTDGPSTISTVTTTKSSRKSASSSTVKSAEVTEDEDEPYLISDDDNYTDSDQSFVSPSESDRDSDLDFSVKERSSKGRKINKIRPPAKLRQSKSMRGAIKKKRQSDSMDSAATAPTTPDDSSVSTPSKKKSSKSHKKLTPNRVVNPLASAAVSNEITTPHQSEAIASPAIPVELPVPTSPIAKIVSVVIKPKTFIVNKGNVPVPKLVQQKSVVKSSPFITSTPITTPILAKNMKKPTAHVESALFSDMTSLFSTPDIIKKVGTPAEPPISNRVTNISVINLPPVTLTPIPLTSSNAIHSNLSKTLFMSLTPTTSRPRPTQITTIRPSNPIILSNTPQNLIIENIVQRPPIQHQTIQLMGNTGIVQNNIIQRTQQINSHTASNLNNVNIASIGIPNIPLQVASQSNPSIIAFTPQQMTSDTSLLNDHDLLDGLGNVEDALSEDLMQHVAKLVEDKNLQQVIDQQVLGVSPSSMGRIPKIHISPMNQQPHTPIESKPKPMRTQLTPVVSQPTTPVQAVATKPKPEPIKIVRSDGRVITLPPIEAPTTRSAKRRAQKDAPVEASPVPLAAPISVETTPKSHGRQPSLAPDRRPSVAARKAATPKIKQNAAQSTVKTATAAVGTIPIGFTGEIIELDDDDEEDGSDGSYNSEDDPYR